ncbi:hypothetical protein SCLCIDRAFT_1212642 [Scleroderma citrinum Foug A]|uniref:Uncharacterized protein n=1 Tax=Scleroderma citrinum Foug A TaxID=1036808 RepID=A0A0C3EAF8_9AGAM|nr:hypothetical protein SCLCIDRAFT_1212642 [Scleroderma citrinum Foug A]
MYSHKGHLQVYYCRGETSGSATDEKELRIQRYESREPRIQIHCEKTMQSKGNEA